MIWPRHCDFHDGCAQCRRPVLRLYAACRLAVQQRSITASSPAPAYSLTTFQSAKPSPATLTQPTGDTRGVRCNIVLCIASPIDLPPVADVQHCDFAGIVVDLVDHAVVADANAPTVTPTQLAATLRLRVVAKLSNRLLQTLVILPRTDLRERLLRSAQKENFVSHPSCSRSISSTACSKETRSSPDAFASS